MAVLKSCPFCGGDASIVETEPRLYRPSRNGKYAVACYGCEIYLGYDEDYGCQFDTEEEAIEAWNTRKPMEAVVAELEKYAKSDMCHKEDYCLEIDCTVCVLQKAIEIVRGKERKYCGNCKHQPEPLTTCEWLKSQTQIIKECPRWEGKE